MRLCMGMIECQTCGWVGDPDECVCSDEDAASTKPTAKIAFDLCPDCKSDDLENLDDEDDET